MTDFFLPYALPDIGEEEIHAVSECLRSGWITTGPKSREFEERFSVFLGGGVESIAVNSATAGLHLALEALGVGPGDEVIVPTLTFTATAEVARYLGADVRLVDVDPVTLNMRVDALRAAIGPRTKVVMPVHYGGLACDMDPIITCARERGIHIVEDAAHAVTTRYKGRLIGALNTDATVFSFYANKTMTSGEGGMLVTRNPHIAARARTMRLHGIDRDAFDRFVSRKPSWHYEVVAPGFKYNLTDIAAAIGIEQLRKVEGFLARREQLVQRYTEALKDLPLILPAVADAAAGGVHAWHLYVVRLADNARIDRNDLIQKLSDRGIGTSVHYVPLHRQPYWRQRYELQPDDFPVADSTFQRMISLPLYTRMSDLAQQHVIDVLRELLQ